ncbi:MoaD/ThiS family protein [Tamlana fucoidanivorans]|uniref:MoaD/ThiS family protein n=1 Tax=Allotamlana fucoidanivorans TaxID=2583814 RepID=A0A5C4SHD3_9FLAO|nr:MoaD/ThiS family protein [Tamlana fucoidanivorans]TNJ42933.1 MoaD/ThiS family protein [Tamlana fucoidanivorans]
MLITIKYFGQIAEVTQKNEEQIETSASHISELLDALNQKYKELKNKDFQIAQNQELVATETKLSGAEIALLPPFSGG